eukprot:5808313-Ditylum_brightwellii.AAC.1
MSYLCNRPYPEVHEFSIEKLERLMPHDIYCWMAWKAYGMKHIEFDPNTSSQSCIDDGFIEASIGVAPMRSQELMNNVHTQKKQYGIKHCITEYENIHKFDYCRQFRLNFTFAHNFKKMKRLPCWLSAPPICPYKQY